MHAAHWSIWLEEFPCSSCSKEKDFTYQLHNGFHPVYRDTSYTGFSRGSQHFNPDSIDNFSIPNVVVHSRHRRLQIQTSSNLSAVNFFLLVRSTATSFRVCVYHHRFLILKDCLFLRERENIDFTIGGFANEIIPRYKFQHLLGFNKPNWICQDITANTLNTEKGKEREGSIDPQFRPVHLHREVWIEHSHQSVHAHVMTAHESSCRICSYIYFRMGICLSMFLWCATFLAGNRTLLRVEIHCWTGQHSSFQVLQISLLLQTHKK